MKRTIVVICLALAGCATTVFAPPTVLYSDVNSIGVKYRSSGIQSLDEPEKAMSIVSEHCKGRYDVTNRSESDGWTTIDVKCE